MAETNKFNLFVENFDAANTVVIFDLSVTVTNEAGQPIETLSGAFSTFTIKKSYKDTTPLVYVTSNDSISIDANTGIVSLALTAADVSAISPKIEAQTFIYDWDLIDSQDKAYRLIKGEITFGGDL